MHFPNWLKLLCAMFMAACLGWWMRQRSTNESSVVAQPTARSADSHSEAGSVHGPYLASTSCAAARCHGGPYDPQHPAWNSAYTVWRADDPHARAYADLLSPHGQEIAARYFINEPSARAERDERCLACHLTPHTPAAAALSEGVGCESCHGPSQAWRGEHYLAAWKTTHKAEGFRDLRHLDVRAQACVGCHVGGPAREVNHDLIAAGHPALRFELGAFHEQLPKHWDAAHERQQHSEMEAQLWLAGQAASSRAALELSIHRMQNPRSTWPELAEYDCESCHHPLAASSWRQALAAGRTKVSPKFGRPLWGTWYCSPGVMRAAELIPNDSLESLATFRTKLSQLQAASDEAIALARFLLKQMPSSTTPQDWKTVASRLEDPTEEAADQTFSAAAQRWLGLAALATADDSNAENASRIQRLKALRPQLAIPAEFDPTATK